MLTPSVSNEHWHTPTTRFNVDTRVCIYISISYRESRGRRDGIGGRERVDGRADASSDVLPVIERRLKAAREAAY